MLGELFSVHSSSYSNLPVFLQVATHQAQHEDEGEVMKFEIFWRDVFSVRASTFNLTIFAAVLDLML